MSLSGRCEHCHTDKNCFGNERELKTRSPAGAIQRGFFASVPRRLRAEREAVAMVRYSQLHQVRLSFSAQWQQSSAC